MITFSKIGNYGRLGNQLFQIATTLALAEENNAEAKFFPWEYAKFFKNPINQSLTKSEVIELHNYTEPAFHYTKIPYRENMNLHGYFQSEKYFKDYSDLIKHHFTFTDGLVSDSLLLNKVSDACSIHIRRGDYVNLSDYHPFPGKEYYIKAMEELKDDVSKFMVFSDDIPWCKAFFGKNDKLLYVENQTNIQDMYLMSLCKHNIIANSSFSWWGAYLNNNKNQKVIAPLNWFGPANKANTKDLYCPKWKIM